MKLYSTLIPYLLLVSYYTPLINDFGTFHSKMINASPYDGVAIQLTSWYDAKRYTEGDFRPGVEVVKKELAKHIWPWVHFNRFYGYTPAEEGGQTFAPTSDNPYFRGIKGMDVYNEAGALGDFLGFFTIALRIARELGSPGIVIDPELYNDYKLRDVRYVANKLGKTEEETKQALENIGVHLADITEDEYPDAMLWFFYTRVWLDKEYRSETYIILGLLKRAKQKGLKLKVISGGESGLGYCYTSLQDLQGKIVWRRERVAPIIAAYPNLYEGGVIAPWDDPGMKRGWMTERKCGQSPFKSAQDFKPLIGLLLRSYQFVWIYSCWAAQYDPYDPKIATNYNKAIEEVQNGQ